MARSSTTGGGRRRHAVVLALLAALVLGAGVWLVRGTQGHPILSLPPIVESCTAIANERTTTVTPEQAGNAAIIAGVAQRRGLPARAVTVALATALQESKLRNLQYGDRDSLGLFQQRPSSGWGTEEQILDPVYAATRFYKALEHVKNWQKLRITVAAQKVQRSAYPEAYAQHEDDARVLASALTGHSPGGLTCDLRSVSTTATATTAVAPGTATSTPSTTSLSSTAKALRKAARRETVGTLKQVGGTDGLVWRFTLHGASASRIGWQLAQWAVARADALDVRDVRLEGATHPTGAKSAPAWTWTRGTSAAEWEAATATAVATGTAAGATVGTGASGAAASTSTGSGRVVVTVRLAG